MTNGPVCPPECKQELKHLWKKMDALKRDMKECKTDLKAEDDKQWEMIDANYKHWEREVSMRVRTMTLVGVVAVVLGLVGTLLGVSFTALRGTAQETLDAQKDTHEQVNTIQRTVDRMEVQLDTVKKDVDRHMAQTDRRSEKRRSDSDRELQ